MILILPDDERATEEQLLAFRRCDPMPLPNLPGVAGIPLKALTLLDDSLQPSHPRLLYMAVTYDDKPFSEHPLENFTGRSGLRCFSVADAVRTASWRRSADPSLSGPTREGSTPKYSSWT